jgi:DNA-binding CsgD family transcriptional regulator
MGIWMNLVGYSSAFQPLPLTPEGLAQPELSRYAFYSGIVVCGLLMALASSRISSIKTSIDFVLALVMCMGTASFGISYQQQLFNPTFLATLGCACSGVGYMWFVVSFYLMLAKKTTLRVAIISIMASLIIETLVAMIFNITLPKQVQVFVGSAMPPLACAILIAMQLRVKVADVVEQKVEGGEERYMLLTVGAALLSLLLIRSVTTLGLWGDNRQDLSLQPMTEALSMICSCVILVIFAWFALIRGSKAPLFARYQAPLLIIILGCLTYTVIDLARPLEEIPIEHVITEAVEIFGHLVNWTVAVTAIKILRFSPYKILGFSAALYNTLAMIWIAFFENSTDSVPALVMFFGFCVILFVSLVPLGLQQRQAPTPNAQATVRQLSADFHLTQREQEILLLLKQGRSRPYIQKVMHLADGTVKTHTTHIYTKLGIHSRQQLLDVLEEYESKGEGGGGAL